MKKQITTALFAVATFAIAASAYAADGDGE